MVLNGIGLTQFAATELSLAEKGIGKGYSHRLCGGILGVAPAHRRNKAV